MLSSIIETYKEEVYSNYFQIFNVDENPASILDEVYANSPVLNFLSFYSDNEEALLNLKKNISFSTLLVVVGYLHNGKFTTVRPNREDGFFYVLMHKSKLKMKKNKDLNLVLNQLKKDNTSKNRSIVENVLNKKAQEGYFYLQNEFFLTNKKYSTKLKALDIWTGSYILE